MHVMVATDGSEAGGRAAAVAAEVFGPDAHYTVVSVGSAPTYTSISPLGLAPAVIAITSDPATLSTEALDRAEDAAADAADAIDASEVTVIADIGGPGPTIVELAESNDVDVIVVGAHDRGWLSRLAKPSVSSYLVDHAPCHVLVARHTD